MEKDKKYKCTKCSEYKFSDKFYNVVANANRDELSYWCIDCHKTQYHNSKERLFKTYSLDRKLRAAFNGSKRRSRDSNRFFDLELSDMYFMWESQNGMCALTGKKMTYEHFCGRLNTNLSLDRIDSSRPYTKHNVQLVCMAANQMKNDLTIEELLDFCESIIGNAAMQREELKARTAIKNKVSGQK